MDSSRSIVRAASRIAANAFLASIWFSGTYGPSGAHLIALSHHSDEVLATFLAMAGRDELMVAVKLAAAEQAVEELLEAVRQLSREEPGSTII
jgi:hypothetical protein